MSTITAFDMGRYYRVVGFEHPRIRGEFIVMGGDEDRDVWIEFRDVLVWMDDAHNWGQTFGKEDFKGKVSKGQFDPRDRDFSTRALDVFKEHHVAFKAIVLACVEAAAYQGEDFKSQVVVEESQDIEARDV